jgi:glucosamine--fructose-6-phosphate aminotransferase (isomerizing)
MCGIVGAVSQRNIVPILLQGLQRLEYRGYDSCGVAVHQGGALRRARSTSRVSELDAQVLNDGVEGLTGIAHTRWATTAHLRYTTPTRISATAPGQAPTAPAPGASRWSTTASSKTTKSCAPNSKAVATCSTARPTPK